MKSWKALLLLSLAVVTSPAPAWASDSPVSPAPAVRAGTATWLEPTHSVLMPQTEAEKAAGQEVGRSLPQPELLQPGLDAALPHYVPTPGLTISRSFKAGSSDVLPVLVLAWSKAFQVFHRALQLLAIFSVAIGLLAIRPLSRVSGTWRSIVFWLLCLGPTAAAMTMAMRAETLIEDW